MVTKARRVAPYASVVAFAMLAGCSATEDTRAPAVGEVASTLCSVVDDSGRVLVCHEISPGRFTLLRIVRTACVSGHARHDNDRAPVNGRCDDSGGPTCVAAGGAVSGTAQCCAGLVARNGVCVDLCAGVVCSALDACHGAGTCDPSTGACSNPSLPDGTVCALPDATAACTGGVCGVVSCPLNRGDCDGVSANGCETATGEACSVGVGACASTGATVCAIGGGTRCDATAGTPVAEVCDGLDNDCNGVTDDIASVSCALGACAAGHTACSGSAVVCVRDAYLAAGTVCRASAGGCDAAESCTGTSDDCPSDQPLASGSACVDGSVTGTCVAFACTAPVTTRAISSRGNHACSLKSNGTVWCSGNNPYGLLGVSMLNPVLTQMQMPSISNADQIAPDALVSTCVRLQDRTVRCWGSNSHGELGNGTTVDSPMPVVAQGLNDVAQLSGGQSHYCALRGDGAVFCWGNNTRGQLGDGTTTDRSVPTQVPGLSGIVMVACGASFTVALHQDGTVSSWGEPLYSPVWNVPSLTPVLVAGLSNVVEIRAAGDDHVCARINDGTVRCMDILSRPSTVPGLSSATQIGVGSYHACALRSDGTMVCWGGGHDGQLGAGTSVFQSSRPVSVLLPLPATSISVGEVQSCAVTVDGRAYCWGSNSRGQLGDGTTDGRYAPVLVIGS